MDLFCGGGWGRESAVFGESGGKNQCGMGQEGKGNCNGEVRSESERREMR